MLDRLDPSALLVDQLKWIEKVAAMVCHKNSVWGDEADDFASLAKLKVLENDYAVLRKFRGECDIRTYLATIVVQRFHEYAREKWGRWRHSAAAERLGQLAKDLELLVRREGMTLHEAADRLRSAGRTDATDADLARLLAQLPERDALRPREVGAEPLEWTPGAESAESRVELAEREARRDVVMRRMWEAVGGLSAEDQLIVRMAFAEGRKVADVARALRLNQPALYKRVERLRRQLRESLEATAIGLEDVRDLLGEDAP